MSTNVLDWEFGVGRIETNHRDIKWYRPYESTQFKKSRGTGFFVRVPGAPNLAQMFKKDNYKTVYMITCAHVVSNANITNVRVGLKNGPEQLYDAAIVLACPDIDMAILAVIVPMSAEIKYIPLGNSDTIVVNSEVHVIGFPLGREIKTTNGTYSGMSEHGIQHSSPISPGNSGGPLIANGKVVGINYQGEVGADVSNMFYAVPINLVGTIIHDALIKLDSTKPHFIYRPPRIGVCYHNITLGMVSVLTKKPKLLEEDHGVMIHWYQDDTIDMLIRLNPDRAPQLKALLKPTKKSSSSVHKQSFKYKDLTLIEKEDYPPCPFFLQQISWKPREPMTQNAFFKSCMGSLLTNPTTVQVNMYGLVKVGWSTTYIPLNMLLRRIPVSFDIFFHGFFATSVSDSEPPKVTLKTQKMFVPSGANRQLFYPFFESPNDGIETMYICVMGMCIMQVHKNHLLSLQELQCIPVEDRNKTNFVVVRVFAQTGVNDSRVFRVGDMITSMLWGKEVIDLTKTCKNIKDLKKVMIGCIEDVGNLSLKNSSNRWFMLDVPDMINLEKKQSHMGEYTPDLDFLEACKTFQKKHSPGVQEDSLQKLQKGANKLLESKEDDSSIKLNEYTSKSENTSKSKENTSKSNILEDNNPASGDEKSTETKNENDNTSTNSENTNNESSSVLDTVD